MTRDQIVLAAEQALKTGRSAQEILIQMSPHLSKSDLRRLTLDVQGEVEFRSSSRTGNHEEGRIAA